jgi:molybdopterin converting factor small subunit
MAELSIQIDYYALFREKRGVHSEKRKTSAATLRQLYEDLSKEFNFALPADRVRVAVHDRFCSWDHALKDGDKIVFIPPVAGG